MSAANIAAFLLALKKETDLLVSGSITRLVKGVATEALTKVVQRTPVDTGEARGEWQVGVNRVPEGKTGVLDPEGTATIAKGIAKIKAAPRSKEIEIHIVNNADHIEVLENGRSDQAPNGMVALTSEEINTRFFS